MSDLIATMQNFRAVDLLDIFFVAAVFYVIFALLRETRSAVALMGFITFLVSSLLIFLVARTWDLGAMTLIFQHSWTIGVLIFLIVFQNELRRVLTEVGKMRLFRSLLGSAPSDILEGVMQAVRLMARSKLGALIVFERRNTLKSYIGTGTQLDAAVTADLIRTIFTKSAPLHDGALVISGDRLVAASCILPMTDNPDLSRELGTRHRAAIALSEETDAVVVVVSEETGTISLVFDGVIERGLKVEELRKRIEKLLDMETTDAQEAQGDGSNPAA